MKVCGIDRALAPISVIFLLLFCCANANGQSRELQTNYETWYGVMTSSQLSKRFSWWNDFHHVNNLFWIARTGITYHNKPDNVVATLGYGGLGLGAPWSDGELIRREHRPWGQVVYRFQPIGRWSISTRYRGDARFIGDIDRENQELLPTNSFNYRHRFNVGVRYSLGRLMGENTITNLSFLNETLINVGPGQNGFPFEHRTHFLFGVRKNASTYTLGYIFRYIEVNDTQARINHGLVLWLSFHLTTRRMKRAYKELPMDHTE